MNTVSLFISSILQVVAFSLIPFIWWFFTARKDTRFFRWLGLTKPITTRPLQLWLLCLIATLLFLAPSFFLLIFVDIENLATSQFAGIGVAAFLPALIYSFIQTGLSEEIFFRGFLAKRLIGKIGFFYGNIVQGFIFGAMHGVLFMFITNTSTTVVIVLFTSAIGYLLGWINEKKAGGSILPSWLLHSVANFIISCLAMFSIIG